MSGLRGEVATGLNATSESRRDCLVSESGRDCLVCAEFGGLTSARGEGCVP